MERGAKLDPLCVLPACALIGAYAAVGREADSRRWTREALRLEPRAPVLFSVRGTALLFQAKYAEARELLERSLAAAPAPYRGLFEIGFGAALGAQGERRRARAILDAYRENPLAAAPWTFPGFVLLTIHAGDSEAALGLLERDVFYSSYPCLLSIRAYDTLRGKPAFKRLLARRYEEWREDVRRWGEPAADLPAPRGLSWAR
jgi:tetratricopeptide (TPR) repeat protein